MNLVVGLTPPQTMKVKGKIIGQSVVVLIDCGATHNFISTKLVQRLGLPKITTTGYLVIMGRALPFKELECVNRWCYRFKTSEVVEDFLPLELGSSDVILRMKWLATLGGTLVNWKELTMKFRFGGTSVTLQGDPSLSKTSVFYEIDD